MRRNSFTWKLMLPVISASILGIFLTGLLAHNIARREILKGVDREINLGAQAVASQLASFFVQRSADLDSSAEVPLIQDYFNNIDFGLAEEAGSYLGGIRKFFSAFIGRTGVHLAAGLLDRKGNELCRVEKDNTVPRRFSRGAFFPRAKAAGRSGRYISGVMTAPGRPPYMIYARPVYNSVGEFRGVIYLETDLAYINEKLSTLKTGPSGFSFISDHAGNIVLGARRPTRGPVLSAVRRIPDTEFSITVMAEEADFLSPLAQIRLVTAGIIIFLGLSVSIFIYRRIKISLSPIDVLVKAAGHFSKNELDHMVEVGDSPEFSVLSKAFNDMAAAIKKHSNDLKDRIGELYSLQKMSGSILKKMNTDEICRLCLEASVTGLRFERGLLYWIDPAAGVITGKFSYGMNNEGFTEEKFRKRSIPLDSDDILARVARKGRPVNVKDPAKEPGCNPGFYRETKSREFCLVPVMGSGRVYGVLAVDNWYSGKAITDGDMENLSIFCNSTGLALQNAELIGSLTESRARYVTTINGVGDAIAGLDENFRVTICNRGAERIFGVSSADIIGRQILSFFPAETAQLLRSELDRAGFIKDFAVQGRNAETGAETSLRVILTPIEHEVFGREWSLVIRDVTEEGRLQTQLIHTEKMSAVGNLISGIAHELNNPLAAVVGFAELLCMAEKPPKTLKEDLDNIRKNAMRCRAIVSTLLNFVRQRRVSRTLCRMNDIVDATQDIMRYKLEKTESIILKKDLAPDLPPVFADPQQIGQVLVNLISNACDATSSNSGPREITITSALSGGKVSVVVRDNGCGISPQNRGKVFQPLFTTKNEKGTGLGLVICKSIMEEHGGRLSLLNSGPDTGTAFELLMEAAAEAPEQERPEEPKPVSGKKVLIIDDEEDLLPVMYRMIKSDGNSVDVASGGAEGIRKMAAGEYDLVISDVEMGQLNGQAVYGAASRMPNPPCFLFVTGDVLNPSLADWAQVNRLVCLPKPFTMSEFRNTVRRLLAISRE